MRALQVDRLQRRRDLAAAETGETGRHGDSNGCKGLSSGSSLPMEFHSSRSVPLQGSIQDFLLGGGEHIYRMCRS